jgi:hypothetical protein
MLATYAILLSNRSSLVSALENLAKRATRKGLPVPYWTFGEVTTETVHRSAYACIACRDCEQVSRIALTLSAEPMRYDGWTFVAAISHLGGEGNLVRTLPGEECPPVYRNAKGNCDHCRANRRRSETYILRHVDGRIVQVGSTCVGDFLRGFDAENLTANACILADYRIACEDGENGVGGGETVYALSAFLVAVAYQVRAEGWLSRTAANAEGRPGTADIVWNVLGETRTEKRATDADHATASEAIAWALALSDATLAAERSDYLHNVRVCARAGYVNRKLAGIGASIVTAYQRASAKVRETAARAAMPLAETYVGVVGKRQSFGAVTLDFVAGYETAYGYTTILKFRTDDGACLVWKASSTSISRADSGKKFALTGTVKEHGEYKGAKQTIVTRCKVMEVA